MLEGTVEDGGVSSMKYPVASLEDSSAFVGGYFLLVPTSDGLLINGFFRTKPGGMLEDVGVYRTGISESDFLAQVSAVPQLPFAGTCPTTP